MGGAVSAGVPASGVRGRRQARSMARRLRLERLNRLTPGFFRVTV